MGNVFHFIGTIKWGLDYSVSFFISIKKPKNHEKFYSIIRIVSFIHNHKL